MKSRKTAVLGLIALFLATTSFLGNREISNNSKQLRFLQLQASTAAERTRIAELGVSIEFVRSDSVWGYADPFALPLLNREGIKILSNLDPWVGRGGHHGPLSDFPAPDSRYHNYGELMTALQGLQSNHEDLIRVSSIGDTIEGRKIWAIHINASKKARELQSSNKPGIVFMGTHHAREHLSTEVPLRLAQHLAENRETPQIKNLLETRDIWIIPMVNPDGVEWDIASSQYRYWRKNRRNNGDGTYGVDLNRNYGYRWGGQGSSGRTGSDTYRGVSAFSEPETQAIRTFVRDRTNISILLTYHTYSELILYPWGHTNESIQKREDLMAHEKMARRMAEWNGYTPQQSSDLYITSGDTTDWSYGELGIFSFTFELSPKSAWDGGFYPGDIIDRVLEDNILPSLYLIELADNPYRVNRPGFVSNVELDFGMPLVSNF